ncbi:hypothetical protein [Microbacterium halophytorum]|uniref:hypothetical protein n=1 Tax=Microbacterium halophytorum TaxID=2067568 RepID=UPI00131A2EA8|nr:hypothetical protein [Microbacterium halophytorum]
MGTARGDLARVAELRERIASMQQRRAAPATLPAPGPLAGLFPDGGPRVGAAYALGGGELSLMLALLGAASTAGEWCCVVGVPELSVEAAAGHGVDLGRLVLIPEPGSRWLQAASSACEVFPLVAVRPPRSPAPAEASRLDARLRDRSSTLLALGGWPGSEAEIEVSGEEWVGIGRGHGLISGRAATVSLRGRRAPMPRTSRVLLPGPTGAVESLTAEQPAARHSERPSLRLVGS